MLIFHYAFLGQKTTIFEAELEIARLKMIFSLITQKSLPCESVQLNRLCPLFYLQ
jgi:hypothetical protein